MYIFHSSIHQWIDIWIVSLFGSCVQCTYEHPSASFCVDICFQFS